jgi:type I restriction enzyme S subunit
LLRFLRHIRDSGELSVFQKQSASALQNFQYQAFLEGQEVLLPTAVLLKEFSSTQATLLRQQQTLAIQSHRLRAARDLLLPRLMSGEIAV